MYLELKLSDIVFPRHVLFCDPKAFKQEDQSMLDKYDIQPINNVSDDIKYKPDVDILISLVIKGRPQGDHPAVVDKTNGDQ